MDQKELKFVTINLRNITPELKRRLKIEALFAGVGLYDYCAQKLAVDPKNIKPELLVKPSKDRT
jgi:hypothetical protein